MRPRTARQRLATPTVSGADSGVRTPDIFLGTSRPSPQYGILGQDAHFGRTVALDLNETHTISLFGVQGGGKSYTLGSIIEAATLPAPPVNQLPQPLATIVFHYSPTLDYEPEFTSMIAPNTDSAQVERSRIPLRGDARRAPGHRGPRARRSAGAAAGVSIPSSRCCR